MRDLVGEALVDPLREELVGRYGVFVDAAQHRVEGLVRDEHRRRRRLSVAVGIDLDDVEFFPRERSQKELVIFDEVEREVGQLLRGAVITEPVGGYADRPFAAFFFRQVVLAAFYHRELDRLVENVFDDIVVAFVPSRNRVAGRDTDERLLDSKYGVNGISLPRQLPRKRKPRLSEVELPGVVSALANEEVSVDGELDLQRRIRHVVDGNDQITHVV